MSCTSLFSFVFAITTFQALHAFWFLFESQIQSGICSLTRHEMGHEWVLIQHISYFKAKIYDIPVPASQLLLLNERQIIYLKVSFFILFRK